jgi:hypothetical protein
MPDEIFSIDFDPQKFIDNVNKAVGAMDYLDKSTDEYRQSVEQLQKTVNNVSFNQPISELNELKNTMKQLTTSSDLAGFFKEVDGAVEAVLADKDKLTAFLKELRREIAQVDDKQTFKELQTVILGVEKQLGVLTGDTKAYTAANESLKKKLRELNNEMLRLEEQGLDNTKVFRDMQREAAKLTDQIGDQRERVRVLSSDTLALDATVDALQNFAAGWQVVEGAMALAGANSEDLQKSMQKLMAIMNIANGLQQINAFLTGQSAAKLVLLNAWTKAQAVSQNILTIAFGASAGAAKALQVAVAGLGIGIAVAGVVFLIDKLTELINKADEAKKKANENVNQIFDNGERLYEREKTNIERANKQAETALLQRGATQEEFRAQEEKHAKDLLALDRKYATIAEKNLKTVTAQGSNATEEVKQRARDIYNERVDAVIEGERKVAEIENKERESNAKKQADARKKSDKKEKQARVKEQTEKFTDLSAKGREALEKYYSELAEVEKQFRDMQVEAMSEGTMKEATKLLNEQADTIEDLNKRYKDLGIALTDAYLSGAISLEEFQKKFLELRAQQAAATAATVKETQDAILEMQFADDQNFGMDRLTKTTNQATDALDSYQQTSEALAAQEAAQDAERKKTKEALFEATKRVWDATLQFLSDSNQAEIEATDNAIAQQQRRVDAAAKIAEQGNAEYLQLEEDRLRKLEAQREQSARRQLAIDSAVQASQILVAVAGAAAQITKGGPVNVITGIASIVAALAAAAGLIKRLQAQQPKFFVGTDEVREDMTGGRDVLYRGRHRAGRDTIPAWLHEGEAVIQSDKNKLYQPTVKAIRRGLLPADVLNGFVRSYTTGLNYQGIGDIVSRPVVNVQFGEMDKRMKNLEHVNREMLEVLRGMNIDVRMDADGFAASITRYENRKKKIRNA